MARFETKKVEIGNNTYMITQMPVWTALTLKTRLAKLLAPALGSLGDVMDSSKSLNELMNKEVGALGAAAKTLFESLSINTEMEILTELMNRVQAIVPDEKGGEIRLELSDKKTWDDVFIGHVFDMYKVAWEVIKFNYPEISGKLMAGAPTLPADITN